MKFLLLFPLLFINIFLVAQKNEKPVNKKVDTIRSTILNENRYIWVHVPEGISSERCPVVYLLDGELHFYNVIETLARLYKETGNKEYSKMIVVSIGNIWERDRDYTPTHVDSMPGTDNWVAKKTGGGEKFTSFMEKELLPYIDSIYPASSDRTLIGHSLGGLLAINTLLNHSKLFRHYVAIDPSMWWDNQKLVKQSNSLLSKKILSDNSLFLAAANTWDKKMGTAEQMKSDTTEKTRMTRPSFALIDRIIANKQNKLRFDWKYYKDHTHMSVPPAAIYDALRFLIKPL